MECSFRSSLDVLPVALGDADLLAVLIEAVANAGWVSISIYDHHVGHVDRCFLGNDATGLGATLWGGVSNVLLDAVYALNEDLLLSWVGFNDLALSALI